MKLKKIHNTFIVLLLTFVIIYLFKFFLASFIGSKGVAYFSIPNELFFLFGFSLMFGLEQSISKLVEYRFSRKSYDNTKIVFKSGIYFAIALSVFIMLILQILGKGILGHLFHMKLTYLSYELMIISLPFMIISGVLRGYFDGTMNKNISTHSYFIFTIGYVLFGGIFSSLLLKYGDGVSVLLRVENYRYTYASLGLFIGVLISSIITLVHLIIIYFIFERRSVFENGRDYVKAQDTVKDSIILIIKNALYPTMNIGLLFLMSVFNQIAALNKIDENDVYVFNYGEYYGKTHNLIMLFVFILSLLSINSIRKSIKDVKKQQFHMARETLSRMIHRYIARGLFIAAMVIVFGNDILSLIFNNNGQAVQLYVETEGILIVLALMAFIFNIMLFNLQYSNISSIICLLSFVVHVVITVLLSFIGHMSIYGIIIANIVFYALWAFLGFVLISRYFQYTQEWFRTVVVSLIASLVCALLGMVLNKSLLNILNKPIALIISFVFSIIVYLVILLLLRGFDEEELDETYIGKFMIMIGRWFNLL